MLVHKFDHLISTTKFQRATIMGTNSSIFVTIYNEAKRQDQGTSNEDYHQFRQSFNVSEEGLITINNMRIFDIRKERGEQYQIAFKYHNNLRFTEFKDNIYTNSKETIFQGYRQVKIINSTKLLAINEKNSIQLLQIENYYDILNKKSSNLYNWNEKFEIIKNLHLISNQEVLFHIASSVAQPYNFQMKCLDVQYQQVKWQIPFDNYSYLMNKVVNINSKTFIHGCVNRQENCLRLFDLRIRGPVMNVARSDDDMWERFNSRWTGRGSIRPDFDHISKRNKEFQIVGMFSFLSGAYNYSYILDLRRPGTIIPIDYPSLQKSLFHVKCFEMMQDNLIAVQRQYNRYKFESARIVCYELKE